MSLETKPDITTTTKQKNVFIIELSEFSVDLLSQAAALHALPNITKILQFKKSSYKTNDRYNSGYLEPYSQWTSVHTGMSARKHLVKQPGDPLAPELKSGWQLLNENKITTLESSTLKPTLLSTKNTFILLELAYQLGCFWYIVKGLLQYRKTIRANLKNNAKMMTFADTITTFLFCRMKEKNQPHCSVLFLESLAYCQSTHWNTEDNGDGTLSEELIYNIKTIDRILGLVMNWFEDDSVIVHNALSQMKGGRRIPLGTVYSQDISFPNHIFNHEFNNYIFHYFMPEKIKLKSEYIEDECVLT